MAFYKAACQLMDVLSAGSIQITVCVISSCVHSINISWVPCPCRARHCLLNWGWIGHRNANPSCHGANTTGRQARWRKYTVPSGFGSGLQTVSILNMTTEIYMWKNLTKWKWNDTNFSRGRQRGRRAQDRSSQTMSFTGPLTRSVTLYKLFSHFFDFSAITTMIIYITKFHCKG